MGHSNAPQTMATQGMLGTMSVPVWFWLLAAVLVFWCVGVYNRVMRLKARSVEALGALEKRTQEWVLLIRGGLPAEWSALHALARALDDAGKSALASPLARKTREEFGRSMDALQSQWTATCAAPSDLADTPFPVELQAPWDEASAHVQSARSDLNQKVQSYNEALQQFPASMVVGMMGFRATDTL